ncbi:hypothetical protein G7Y79_00001g003720 [Physcia stellaris]|nr:hypothetical protein G7Y79_00001g003720 [Physcia stellaris]
MVSLSEKEVELMKIALQHCNGGEAALIKTIDFEKVHVLANYKDAKNAKVMFGRLLAKLSGGKEKPGSPAAKGAKAAAKPQGVTKAKPEVGKRGRKKKGVINEFVAENDGNIAEDAGDEGVTKELEDEGE